MFGRKIKISDLNLNPGERLSIQAALKVMAGTNYKGAKKLFREYASGVVSEKSFKKIVEYVAVSLQAMKGTDAEKTVGVFLDDAYNKIRHLG